MPHSTNVILDDRLLIEELLAGLRRGRRQVALHTTTYWYYRACRAATAGSGGHLSGPFAKVPEQQQARAVISLLTLREDIALPDARETVPAMAQLATAHPRLNLLNLEAAAAARVFDATVWLSEEGADGILPSILDAEGLRWQVVSRS